MENCKCDSHSRRKSVIRECKHNQVLRRMPSRGRIYEHRFESLSPELGYKMRGWPFRIGTGTLPSPSTSMVEQVMISVRESPLLKPVSGSESVYSWPFAPRFETIVTVCEPSGPLRMARVLSSL